MHRILYVDDEPSLLEIAKLFLEEITDFSVDVDTSALHALYSIGTQPYDAIISDYQMPEMDGIAFLKTVRSKYGDIPFILFTGRGREEVVIEAINNGADFYLQKGGDPTAQFAELAHKIRQAIARRQAEFSLIQSEKRLTDIINFLPDATLAIDRSGHIIAWNRAIEEMTGVAAADMLGKGEYEYAVPFYGTRRPILIDLIFEPDEKIEKNYAHIIHEKNILIADTTLPRPMGRTVTLMGKASPLYNRQGEIVGAIESIRDITGLKKAEEGLLHAQKDWETIFRAIGHPAIVLDANNRIIDANDSALTVTGESLENLKGKHCYEVFHGPDADQPPDGCPFEQLKKTGTTETAEVEIETLNGYYHVSCTPVYDAAGKLEKVIHIAMDVTARRRTQDELRAAYEQITASEEELRGQYEELSQSEQRIRESEEKYRLLVEVSRDIIYSLDLDGTILYISPQSVDQIGYRLDEMAGRNFTEFIHQDDIGILVRHIQEHAEPGSALFSDQFRLRRKDGAYRWFEDKSIYTIDHRGQQIVIGTIGDITERKEAEYDLKNSVAFLNSLIDQSPTPMWISDENGKLIRINRACCDLLNINESDVVGKYSIFDDNIVKEQGFLPRVRDVFEKGVVVQFQITYDTNRLKNLTLDRYASVILEVTIFPVRDNCGKITNAVIQHTNITDRKLVEEELRESEEKFREIFENTTVAVFQTRLDGSIATANPAFAQMLGFDTPEEAIREIPNIRMIYVNSDQRDELYRILSTRDAIADFELALQRRDRSTLWVSVNVRAFRDSRGKITGLEGLAVDITPRKKAEADLRENEKKYRSLVETTGTGFVILDGEGRVIDANPEYVRLTGHTTLDEISGRSVNEWTAQYEKEKNAEAISRCMRDGYIRNLEIDYVDWSGNTIPIEVNATVLTLGDTVQILSLCRDISGRRRTQNALQEREVALFNSQQMLQMVLDTIPQRVFWKDRNSVFLGCNKPLALDAGFAEPADMVGKTDYDHASAATADLYLADDRYVMETGHSKINYEEPQVRSDGSKAWLRTSKVPLCDKEGSIIGVLGTYEDITEHRLAEEALRESEAQFRTILHSMQSGIVIIDAQTHTILDANPKALEMIGGTNESVVGSVCHHFICPAESCKCPVTDLGQTIDSSERILLTQRGEKRPILKSVIKTILGEKEVLIESFVDITDRKKAEDALRESEERYRSLFENNHTVMLLIDPDTGAITDANPAACAYYRWSHEELIQKRIDEINTLTTAEVQDEMQLAYTQKRNHFFFKHRLADGTIRDVEVYSAPIRLGGRLLLYSIIFDITERKKAEQMIMETNKKINLLTSITRHDVANQVSILRGFAKIAMMKNPDPVVVDLLAKIDATGSVITRQIAFTKAYQELGMHAPGWHRIREIVAKQKTDGISLSCTCNADVFADPMLEKVFFNLIDNAARHGERVTTITVSCKPDQDDLVITVEDNGAGVPLDLKEKIFEKGFGKNTGFGLFLAKEILAITGISIRETGISGNGARFEINVPKGMYRSVV